MAQFKVKKCSYYVIKPVTNTRFPMTKQNFPVMGNTESAVLASLKKSHSGSDIEIREIIWG